MKINCFFTAVCSLFFIQSAVAQQSVVPENEPEIIQTISVRRGQPQQVHDKAYYERMILDLDLLSTDIDLKVEHVQSNEEYHKVALEIGWYETMRKNKEEILEQRKEYLEKIKLFN